MVVREGGVVVITERGRTVGHLIPASDTSSDKEQLLELVRSGMVEWGGGEIEPSEPPARWRGGKSVAEMLIEDRR